MRQWLHFNLKKYINDMKFKRGFKIDKSMEKSENRTF